MSLKIDIANIVSNNAVKTNTLTINDYTITTGKDKNLLITKDDQVIAEYKNNSWYFNGMSIQAIWDTLTNHFDAIQKILKILNN